MTTTKTSPHANPMADLFPQWDVVDGKLSLDVQVAYDAMSEGREDAHELLTGLPATVSIGSDRYAAKVIRATPKTVVVDFLGEEIRFRHTKRGWRSGSHRLTVGKAEDYRDPSF